ncbi:MAG: hypothetical protein KAY32_15235 [Candidatus Eisenbacteria sp.]|nr:hypothetical protein [Candidatus Eisenbacteria bacterium]
MESLAEQIAGHFRTGEQVKVAVLDFIDLEGNITPLGMFISEELITRLFQSGRFNVIERRLLSRVLEEQKLTASGLFEAEAVQRLGKLLGLRAIVAGTCTELVSSVKVNARIIDATTGEVSAAASATIPKTDDVRLLIEQGVGGASERGGTSDADRAISSLSDAESHDAAGDLDTPAIQSVFDGKAMEGWAAHRVKFRNPGAGGSGGGPDNGCLIKHWDSVHGVGYFVAPQRFHGNWLRYSRLEVDLWSSGGDYFDSGRKGMQGDILVCSGSASAWRLLPSRPPGQWKTFAVPLEDDGLWTLGGGAASLADVLVNVTDFRVRARYGNSRNQCGMDNVRLFPR